jgi:hypothetical protein
MDIRTRYPNSGWIITVRQRESMSRKSKLPILASVGIVAVIVLVYVNGDPIDHLIKSLSSQKNFDLGMSVDCELPASASPTEMTSNALQGTFILPAVTNFTIVAIKDVRISDSMSKDTEYTAVLADSNLGQKIVLYKLEHAYSNGRKWDQWWSRVYDVK